MNISEKTLAIVSIIYVIVITIVIIILCIDCNNIPPDVTEPMPTIMTTNHETETPTEPTVEQWWTEDELDMLAAVIYYEAGSSWCTDRHQQLVGQVILNRVKSHEFPDTIYDVITQTKPTLQYASMNIVLKNMGNRDIIPQRCYDNALLVLNGEVECPDDIVWQAEFIQGEIYEVYETPYSTTYFCYR